MNGGLSGKLSNFNNLLRKIMLIISCQSTSKMIEPDKVSTGSEKIYFVGRPYNDNPEAIIYSVNFDGSELAPVADQNHWITDIRTVNRDSENDDFIWQDISGFFYRNCKWNY